MAKAKPKQDQKPSKVSLALFVPAGFSANRADEDWARFLQIVWKHNVLRTIAMAAASSDQDMAAESSVKANEAFLDVLRFTAVQCPYCLSPQTVLDNQHLSNCPEMQSKHAGAPESWTFETCLKENVGIITKSWISAYVTHLSSVTPAPTPQPVQNVRPAVVTKRQIVTPPPRNFSVAPPMRKQEIDRPAVVQRKFYVPPRFGKRK